MRTATPILVALVAGLEIAAASLSGSACAVAAAIVLGFTWTALAIRSPTSRLHGLGLWASLGLSAFLAVSGVRILPLVTTTLTLFSWDASTLGRILAHFSPERRVPIPQRYVAALAGLGSIAVLLGLIGEWIPVRVPFQVLLGLLIAVLALVASVLWIGRRAARGMKPASAGNPQTMGPAENDDHGVDA